MSRQCPLCQRNTSAQFCCGIDLTTRRRWRMTRDMVKFVHVLGRSRKGLTEENYRLHLSAIGAESSLQLNRDQFHQLIARFRALPDSPKWVAKHLAGGIQR